MRTDPGTSPGVLFSGDFQDEADQDPRFALCEYSLKKDPAIGSEVVERHDPWRNGQIAGDVTAARVKRRRTGKRAAGNGKAGDRHRVGMRIAVGEIERQIPVLAVEAEAGRIDGDLDRVDAAPACTTTGGQRNSDVKRTSYAAIAVLHPLRGGRRRTCAKGSKNRARSIYIMKTML
jgi:hypothetical protein